MSLNEEREAQNNHQYYPNVNYSGLNVTNRDPKVTYGYPIVTYYTILALQWP